MIVIALVGADSRAEVIPEKNLDPKTTSTFNSKGNANVKPNGIGVAANSDKVDRVKDEKDQVDGSEKGVENKKLNEGSGDKKQTSSENDNILGKEMDDGDEKKNPEQGSESIETTKDVKAFVPPVREEGSRVEECDTSNSCKDEKVGLVACLRVPGNESPEVSLLVQNKGKGPLNVTIISAPDFVKLEKTQIQLKENEDDQVKVSIAETGTKNLIVLTAGKGKCTLNFQGLVTLNLNKDKVVSTTESVNTNNAMKRIPLIAFVVFGAIVVSASAWMRIRFPRRHLASKNSKYQKLDMDLPVSGGGKVEFASIDGWDNSWGDDWDDEEAPKTTAMPLTPSLSAKGLAPRRLNKEAWKD